MVLVLARPWLLSLVGEMDPDIARRGEVAVAGRGIPYRDDALLLVAMSKGGGVLFRER